MQVEKATLLSTEEYEQHKAAISKLGFNFWWWLRSPGTYSNYYAAGVDDFGYVYSYGFNVDNSYDAVVPALVIVASKSEIGSRFSFGDKEFLILSPELAICTSSIGKHCFREDWQAPDANDYEASDVKKFVDEWFHNRHS